MEPTKYPDVVRILIHDDGAKEESPRWCFIMDWMDSERTLCGGEVFGMGEGRAEFKLRTGRITCPRCIEILKELRTVKI